MRNRARWWGLLLLMITCRVIAASLVLDTGTPTTLSTQTLLAMPSLASVQVPADVTFHRTMTYRAVPLRALPGIQSLPDDAELKIVATDGFVTHLPVALIRKVNGAVPWLAIETADQPWPKTSQGVDAGPFYLVWTNPAASGVLSEQWPYQIDSIRAVAANAVKWPQLAIENHVSQYSPIRRGQTVFVTECMVCHRMDGAGDAAVGPDLNLPHNPTEYFQPWALKAYIRNPKSVRAWSAMRMPGFDSSVISDSDLDAIIAFLHYMAQKPK